MSDLSTKTFCVADHRGLAIGLARRLALSGARVFFCTPIDRRDTINDAMIGGGLKDVHWVEDVWENKDKTDVFVYPDIRHQAEQNELRSQGCSVWGSQKGMLLEQDRQFFLENLKEFGLDVPPFDEIMGLTNLTVFLKDKKDIWIKVSKWRGSFETFHWRSPEQDGYWLDLQAVKFGGIKEGVRFLCFPKIETDLEIGADTYCIDGQWPAHMLHGLERKDAAYFAAVTDREQMPEQLLPVMQAFSPFLEEVGYRNQWSMEVRVAKEGDFFIDATTRCGFPSSASFLAAKNTPEVIYHGAHGEFVEIDYGYKFSAECMIKVNGQEGAWETVVLDDAVRKASMLQNYCEVDGQAWFPPDELAPVCDLGWLWAVGDTPKEVLEKMNELADALPDGADAQVEALADVIREIESEQEQGIHFTNAEIPEPDIVLEPS